MNRRQALTLLAAAPASAVEFHSRLTPSTERVWIGPEYWANPMQDWRLRDGRMECIVAGGERNVFLLTHELRDAPGRFEMRVRLGPVNGSEPGKEGFVGFRAGIRSRYNDYRDDAVYGIGMNAGVTADGRLFIGKLNSDAPRISGSLQDVELRLTAAPAGSVYTVKLGAFDKSGKPLGETTRDDVPATWLTGGVALVCHSGEIHESPDPSSIVVTMSGLNRKHQERGGTMRFWFTDWRLSGDKFAVHEDRAWGPILFAIHTLSRGVMKLSAQIAPIDVAKQTVRLEIKSLSGGWKQVGTSTIDPEARNAVFRVARWDATRDTPYRVVMKADREHILEGVIRKDPVDKQKIVVAGISCVNDLGFPHNEVVRGLKHFRPDIALFTGDQIYERVGGYGIQRLPIDVATLDYLRKWYIFGWAFRDILADTPSVCMPDDHDVYHGNVWGAGGRHAEGMGQPGQDSGGYTQPAPWVNMMQRTQTSHLPDAFDPTPVEQGIGVYYTSLKHGGIDYAILEDRKWKSAPKTQMPKAKVVNGWAQNPDYNPPVDGDVPGAHLLGDRQIRFLDQWAADWKDGTWMKVAVSQTIFANIATLPKPANTDSVTGKLPILKPGEYSEGEVAVADHDSNGWPQTPRNNALRSIRRAAAFHIAGDQHLGSTIQYGIDDWNDASWAVCVPAVSNLFPRRWYPPTPGRNPDPQFPRNSGEFRDGFGNKVTVHAVFNPQAVGIEPVEVNHRAPGYGIIEFDKPTRKITIANWARWEDPSKPGAKPVAGWPITIDQTANGMPSAWTLEAVEVPAGAVVQIVDDGSKEIVYTFRPSGTSFTPGVPREGAYTVRLLADNGRVVKTVSGRQARKA
jgi:hypothetical protein